MIPARAVEAASEAFWNDEDRDSLVSIRKALEAALPHMLGECEAEALEDAAAAFPSYGPERKPADAITWLNERAALIRRGVHP